MDLTTSTSEPSATTTSQAATNPGKENPILAVLSLVLDGLRINSSAKGSSKTPTFNSPSKAATTDKLAVTKRLRDVEAGYSEPALMKDVVEVFEAGLPVREDDVLMG